MENVKEQIRNIKVAIGTMEKNNELSEANRIILELGLETLEELIIRSIIYQKNMKVLMVPKWRRSYSRIQFQYMQDEFMGDMEKYIRYYRPSLLRRVMILLRISKYYKI